MLTAFDAPVMDLNCERRPSSTVASQSLMLMNSESVLQLARKLADRARQAPVTVTGLTISADAAARLRDVSASPWSFGFGGVDDMTGRVSSFRPLNHWTGSQWQGGEKLPDAEHGWVLVHQNGGHPGGKPDQASIRRWTAATAGELSITGNLKHGSPSGDGVRGRIVSSRQGVIGEWTASNSGVETTASAIHVEAGDTLDFVADCRTNENADSYEWTVTLSRLGPVPRSWSSTSGFHGPESSRPALVDQIASLWRAAYSREITQPELDSVIPFAIQQLETLQTLPADVKKLTPPADDELVMLMNLGQQLISSNEFLYVD